jgi:OPT oligopeptide transporter protein
MPVLTGVSIFCLANRNSLVFTNLFGGSQGNEGLGFLSFCFDWQYVAGTGSPLWMPLQTLCNSYIGYLLCTVLFMSLYYGNVWNAQNFPFLSQLLFDPSSNATTCAPYNQKLIFNSNNEIDPAKLKDVGVPWLTATYIGALITNNMGFSTTITHMMLWNFDDIKTGWSFLSLETLQKLSQAPTWRFWEWQTDEQQIRSDRASPDLDPHYKLLLKYSGVPQWWWLALLACTFATGLVCIYVLESTLPWWGYIISILLAAVMILFFGAQMAITGFQFNMEAIVQMIAGYCHPYRPLGMSLTISVPHHANSHDRADIHFSQS